MIRTIDLSGIWQLQMDAGQGAETVTDTIRLPGTTSCAQKGEKNTEICYGSLTDDYRFEGDALFSRTFFWNEKTDGGHVLLFLERTRMTTVWINGKEAGTCDSLCSPHIYEITPYLVPGENHVAVRVRNTGYPTRGGHMTSPDTQSNWNGITGRIELQVFPEVFLSNVRLIPHVESRCVQVIAEIAGAQTGVVTAALQTAYPEEGEWTSCGQSYPAAEGKVNFLCPVGENALLWDEFSPCLYRLRLTLGEDIWEGTFGLREFKANRSKFSINGTDTFLRGKHDGMIFPLTGYAPTGLEDWMRVMGIAKSYGINHYRFHTCCPPEAAFEAADRLGIYMEPELPFWGTVSALGEPGYNPEEQAYLIAEGERILRTFGNHPSFVMFSLGNELWGSQERLREILRHYRTLDSNRLYTQGSNNFQFVPCILEEDDFFCGVRFSRDRLIRGSYAMCDAPLGHIQTQKPASSHCYDAAIMPDATEADRQAAANGKLQIQYGTGVKEVEASGTPAVLIPKIPVISHEIGQYETFPDFSEIPKYTGALKPYNLEAIRSRMAEKGLLCQADDFFYNSGKLAVQCYKQEIETALRSSRLAGFQLLDLQDFSGQGTALVGVLNAFMENKGSVTPEEWRMFCAPTVLLAEMDTFIYESGDNLQACILLSCYQGSRVLAETAVWRLESSGRTVASGSFPVYVEKPGLYPLGNITCPLPDSDQPAVFDLILEIPGAGLRNCYPLWCYPKQSLPNLQGRMTENGRTVYIESTLSAAKRRLAQGEPVLLVPDHLEKKVPGMYCTDFWCYPMFRSISENMGKPVPTGTMGLVIDAAHPALKEFPTNTYATPQWYEIVQHADCAVLDALPEVKHIIVQMADNFERCHRLGILFEMDTEAGPLLVCTVRLDKIAGCPEGKQWIRSILYYLLSKS